MRYLLLIYTEEPSGPVPDEVMLETMEAYNAFTREMHERDLFRGGEALLPTNTATTVRVRDGETLTTDGPFAETKEALGGFYQIEAKDVDAALRLAAACPGARWGSIEVRPIVDFDAGQVPA